jgi:hypothetical protein
VGKPFITVLTPQRGAHELWLVHKLPDGTIAPVLNTGPLQMPAEWKEAYEFGLRHPGRLNSTNGVRVAPIKPDVAQAMAAEYQAWIDHFHAGGDYDGFLKQRLAEQDARGVPPSPAPQPSDDEINEAILNTAMLCGLLKEPAVLVKFGRKLLGIDGVNLPDGEQHG